MATTRLDALRSLLRTLADLPARLDELRAMVAELPRRLDKLQLLVGRLELERQATCGSLDPRDGELGVYSQWGEDGIIQLLLRHVRVPRRVFIEFGVEDYREANTRFLLENDDWSGLILDSSPAHVQKIVSTPLYWRHDLKAVCALIDAENVNQLFRAAGVTGDIGLLSIDIDGNDYWVWQAIEVVRPAIVVCEYNSTFGPTRRVTVPYARDFQRARAHSSWLYYGASIGALERLGAEKGYALVAGNRAGNNAFFVRDDLLGPLRRLSPAEAWVRAPFRESRGPGGDLTHLPFEQRLVEIADLPLVDVDTGQTIRARELA